MKKLYLADDLGGGGQGYKTTKEIIKYFKDKYEMKYEMYWDAKHTDWADATISEWGANNSIQLSTWAQSGVSYDWSKKQLIVRLMDIEAYCEQYRDVKWDKVTDLVYTAKHIYGMADKEMHFAEKFPKLRIWHIPLSVDLKEWTYRERPVGRNIAVVGQMWAAKSPEMIFQFAHMLLQASPHKDWKIYVVGDWPQGTWGWMRTYRDNIIKVLGLENNVILCQDHIPDLNKWLDDKDYLITFSQKDAFSLVVAEAMAKGIKALPHHFWGAKDIWGKYVWDSLDELVNRVLYEQYEPKEYYDYIAQNYSNDVILPKWDAVLKAGENHE